MRQIKNVDIDLDATITCGQIFRYEKQIDNSYTIILTDRVVNIKKDNNNLIIKSNNYDNIENIIINYLDLNTNYDEINKKLIKENNDIKKIIDFSKGFKIIRQPRFECIISYIISQNNKVSQITNVLNNIAKKYGDKVIFENKEYYLFPDSEKLKEVSISDYRNLKAGFRDRYLYNFIEKLNNREIDLDYIDTLSSEDALKYLTSITGIGQKVASCILLFSYSRFDVFPIDTWVKKYMKDNYNLENINDMKKFAKDKYKNYSGLVIQYMFHYNRNSKNLLEIK